MDNVMIYGPFQRTNQDPLMDRSWAWSNFVAECMEGRAGIYTDAEYEVMVLLQGCNHKWFVSSLSKSCEDIFCFFMKRNDQIKSQICTCPHRKAVIAYAYLWHVSIIRIKFRAKCIFQILDYELINHWWNDLRMRHSGFDIFQFFRTTKTLLVHIEYHIHIWQVSLQLGFSDTYEV